MCVQLWKNREEMAGNTGNTKLDGTNQCVDFITNTWPG